MSSISDELGRIAFLPAYSRASEEDIKINITLPFLRAFGYDDSDFNYENRTGKGYVDVATDRFPASIVVETKAPQKNIQDYISQLEEYVFQKHSRDRVTVAILTNGEDFLIYGLTAALWSGSLVDNQIEKFKRSQLADPALVGRLVALFSRGQNQRGAIREVINNRRLELREMNERMNEIDTELMSLLSERDRIDSQVKQLQAERESIVGAFIPKTTNATPVTAQSSGSYHHPVSLHILRILSERQATSKSHAVERAWLDDQLINKVDGVRTKQEVSHGLIELKRDAHKIEYEKRGNKIGPVWLT